MEKNQIKFKKNLIIAGKMGIRTGLHIGGLQETVKIGGTDSPVILGWKKYNEKEKSKIVPIIPGSSLKGKMRSLLDVKYAEDIKSNKVKGYVQVGSNYIKYPEKSVIPAIFGLGASEAGETFNRTRLVVRDAYPTKDTIKEWELSEELIHGTEIKGENTIDKITSAANPRFIERVPAESEFNVEMILSIYNIDNEKKMLKNIIEGLLLLEDSYLGGMGTRGYGKVEFKSIKIKEKKAEHYEKGVEGKNYELNEEKIEDKTPEEILNLLSG